MVGTDRAVHTVVKDEHDRLVAGLACGAEFLDRHLEITVTGETHHGPVGVGGFRRNRGRQAVAHRAVLWRQQSSLGPVTEALVVPHREVAGAVGEDHIGRRVGLQPSHGFAHIEWARLRRDA